MGADFMLEQGESPVLRYLKILTDIQRAAAHHDAVDIVSYAYDGGDRRILLFEPEKFLLGHLCKLGCLDHLSFGRHLWCVDGNQQCLGSLQYAIIDGSEELPAGQH